MSQTPLGIGFIQERATGHALMKTETELVLKSRRVMPGRLSAAGFRFDFPAWPAAVADLVGRWRAGR